MSLLLTISMTIEKAVELQYAQKFNFSAISYQGLEKMVIYLKQCGESLVTYATPLIHNAKEFISSKIHLIWTRAKERITLVLQICQPWYERTIRPLKTIDYMLMIASIFIACLVTKVSLAILGIPALPLAAGLSIATFIGAGWIIRGHIRQYHNKIAYEQLQGIIQQLENMNLHNPDFTETTRIQGELQKPQYNHLEKIKQNLEKKIDDFKERKTRFFIQEKIVLGELTAAKTPGSDKKALDILENEISHLYSSIEDISTISEKIALFQAINNEAHIEKLLENIQLLLKYRTEELIPIKNALTDLVEYIKNLQISILQEF